MPLNQNVWPGDTVELSTDPVSGTYIIHPGSLWLDTSLSPPALKYRNTGNTAWINTDIASLGSYTDTFVATANQTSFVLTYSPLNQASIWIVVNSIPQDPVNITGLTTNTVTVLTGLGAGDTIAFYYPRLN